MDKFAIMQSEANRIISDIYKGNRLVTVPALAALLSLIAAWAVYGYTAGPWGVPLWLTAWAVSLPLTALPALLMRLAESRGISATVSFAAVTAITAAVAFAVYGRIVAEEGLLWRRVCLSLSLSTAPYLLSCAAVACVTRYVRKHDTDKRRPYSSLRMDFLSERGKVELSITSDRFLYMESESNYLTVTYLDKDPRGKERPATRKIRSSLKSTEARFGRLPLIKANRSCIVNRERIDYVVREGRGGMLKLHGHDDMLKISQQNYNAFAEYAEQRAGD